MSASLEELQALEAAHSVLNYARGPVAFVRGEGARLWDAQGHEYLDFLTGISVLNVGHCHPHVVAAVRAQAGELLHASNLFYTEGSLRLAQRLAQRTLGGRVMFANSGAEVVEAAIKLARKARRGGEILSVHGAFHGRTYGALSATPQEAKQEPFAPLVGGFRAVPPTAEALSAAIGEHTAAVLLEPIRGESGVHPLGLDALRAARDACDEHGAALILDEIQTGMGRTGSLFAYEALGVVPDVLLSAKSLGGGLPIGALVTGPRLADVFAPGDHGSTFAGGPLVCAAAHAALDVLDDPDLLAHVRELGARMADGLRALPGVGEVRQRGLMIGFDLAAGAGAPALVRRALLEQRLVLHATGPATVRALPPLIVGAEECDDALARIAAALAA